MITYTPISLSSKNGPAAENPWIGATWTVEEPWPHHALIQGYDAQPDQTGHITMTMENGWAKYKVVRKDAFGAFECDFVHGEFNPPD